MNKSLWILISLLAVLPMSSQAEIYKWKDSTGKMRYSDTPPPSNVPHQSLKTDKAQPAPPVAPAAETKDKNPAANNDAPKPKEGVEVTNKNEELKEAELKIRKHNCELAKTNLQTLKRGGRIYTKNEKGEEKNMTDADVAQGIEQAQKDIAEYCE